MQTIAYDVHDEQDKYQFTIDAGVTPQAGDTIEDNESVMWSVIRRHLSVRGAVIIIARHLAGRKPIFRAQVVSQTIGTVEQGATVVGAKIGRLG